MPTAVSITNDALNMRLASAPSPSPNFMPARGDPPSPIRLENA